MPNCCLLQEFYSLNDAELTLRFSVNALACKEVLVTGVLKEIAASVVRIKIPFISIPHVGGAAYLYVPKTPSYKSISVYNSEV